MEAEVKSEKDVMQVEETIMHVDPAADQSQDKSATTVLESEIKDETEVQKELPVTIDARDYSYLKKNNYEQQRNKWSTTFVLQHRMYPKKIVELRAASACHACKMIHWKPNQVRLLSQKTDQTADVVDNLQKMISDRSKKNFHPTALV